MAAEVLRGAVDGVVGARFEGAQVEGGRGGRIDDHTGRVRDRRIEVRHRQERVRRCLQPDEVDSRRRWRGLVELDNGEPPALQEAEEPAGAEVGALGEPDRRAGLELGEHERRHRRRAGGKEEGLAALEIAERPLRLDTGGVPVALVVEVAGLAVAVPPDRRAVDRHGGNSTFRFDAVRLLCLLSSISVEKAER